MRLPEAFIQRMKQDMGSEFTPFFESFEKERAQALRVNTLKVSPEVFKHRNLFSLREVSWCKEGFYYEKEERPGKHPYHEAGLYYMQEPSAMAVGVIADAKPGERVLDLCAAPGGKTTHLAMQMKGEGLLVSNEIHPARAKILAQNVERMGIKNAVVTNESPQALANHFPEFFDRIVVDAPCSGEGMFRKEEQAVEQWSLENVAMCASRQEMILEEAHKMLRAGGTMIYSTCTFASAENEGTIGHFLEAHPEYSLLREKELKGISKGEPKWSGANPITEDTYRLWPHKIEGEGHFVAVLKKKDEPLMEADPIKAEKVDKKIWGLYQEFAKENLQCELPGEPLLFGEQLYLLPQSMLLKGIKVVRPGLHLGTIRKNRFEPSHSLALALCKDDVLHSCSFAHDSKEIAAYLRGETICFPGEKGWNLVLVDGYSIGWGKWSNGILKNHYPKGLRLV